MFLVILKVTIIFKLGMKYYLKMNVFFLSKDDTWADDAWIFSHCFCMACDWFGKGKVTELVDEIILKSIWRRPIVIQNLVLVAATNPDILVDSLYFLFCRNLTASIPFYS
mmetsp:Transcript_10242/g.22732  ORF Transcript_10242/g.22732 Transcript_10242/m.22732 type:complete len:110 (-) Transcript_10242:1765-2094(-)